MGAELFLRTMRGENVPRPPYVPKIWLDLAKNLTGRGWEELMGDPVLAAGTVMEAAEMCGCDAARVFLFPKRRVEMRDGGLCHLAEDGRVLGKIDLQGGLATALERQEDYDPADPSMVVSQQYYNTPRPKVTCMEDLERVRIPTAQELEELYGDIIDRTVAAGGEKVYGIGDCGPCTMAYCVNMMGMSEAMMGMYDDPELIMAVMDKGLELGAALARLNIDHGIRVLRYNDSAGNMSLLSPDMWREFIAPRITQFCSRVHAYCPEAKVYCHICGNVMPILKDLVQTGLDCIAPLDPLGGFTVQEARQAVGGEMVLMGGVNTLTFLNGAKTELEEECRIAIEGGFNGGRYVLGSGCVVPRDTSLEQLLAASDAARAKISCKI